jgi:glycerol-3-phosphate dehydrogenase
MKRDMNRLSDGPFDVLVVGGGIYGAWTAYDASLRGLKVALIDKSDWASGASSASSKLIHGGLRYLEQFHFGMVRRSLDERRRLVRLGPHRVQPLRFLIPVYRHSRVGPLRLRTGLWIYDRLAGSNQPVGPHESMSRSDVLSRHGYLNGEGLVGGLTYGDCQMDDAQFAIEIVRGASDAGAVTANYMRAAHLYVSGGRVVGASVVDELSGDTMDIAASVVVNTTSMWAPQFDDATVRAPRVRMSKGAHLILPPLPTNEALLITARSDERVFFVIPWYGKTLLGTTDSNYDGDLDDVHVSQSDIDYLLSEASAVIGEPKWDESMIEGRFAGVRALKFETGKSLFAVTREWVLESPVDRLLVSVGGKYTSARADAAVIVDRVVRWLGKKPGESPTKTRPFPWSPKDPFPQWLDSARDAGIQIGMDRETAMFCAGRYGSAVEGIHALIHDRVELAERLDPRLPFCKAEIIIAARESMAVTLEDLLRRRMPILILSRVDRDVLDEAVRLVSPTLGWDDERGRREIENVLGKWSVEVSA